MKLIASISSFYMDHNVYEHYNVSYGGKAYVHYYISHGRFKNEGSSYYYGCDPYDLFQSPCEIIVYFHLAIFGDFGKVSRLNYWDYYWAFNRWSRQVGVLNPAWRWPGTNIGIYINTFEGPWNTNIISTPVYYHYHSDFLRIVDLCVDIWDSDPGYDDHLIFYCWHGYFQNLHFDYAIFRSKDETNSLVWTTIKATCVYGYWTISCFYYCDDVMYKNACNLQGQVCFNGWQHVMVTYNYYYPADYFKNWNRGSVTLLECLIYDVCLSRRAPSCPIPGERCFPTANGTYACISFNVTYVLSTYKLILPGFNYSFDTLFDFENVTIELKLSGSQHELFINRSHCNWLVNKTINDPGYMIDIDTDPLTLIPRKTIKYGKYNFAVLCEIGQSRTFVFPRDFTIIVVPRLLFLYNLTLGDGAFIYLGQTVGCSSDSTLENISQYILTIDTDNFVQPVNRKRKNILNIPLSAYVGYCVLNCSLYYVLTDRNQTTMLSNSWSLDIRTYVKFYWLRKYKNVYSPYEFAGCLFLAYFAGKTDVKVFIGPSEINTQPGFNFSTKTTMGGEYMFMCTLTMLLTDLQYYNRHSFEIFYFPTFVCLLINLPTPGSFLRCGSDAYPDDQVSYRVTLTNGMRVIMSSKTKSLQIPYDLKFSDFRYKCQIVMIIDDKAEIMTMQQDISFQNDAKLLVTFTEADYTCAKFMGNMLDNARHISETQLEFHSLLYILFPESPSFGELFFFLAYSLLVLQFLFMFALRNKTIRKSKQISFKFIRRREVNDKLVQLTRIANQGQMLDVNDFFKKFSNFSSQSTVGKGF